MLARMAQGGQCQLTLPGLIIFEMGSLMLS